MDRPQLFVPLGHTWGVDHVHSAGYARTTHVKSADRGLSGTKVTGSIEAELRPSDLQALERKVALKRRDGGVERVFLVLADTRHNRALLRLVGDELRVTFPLQGPAAKAAVMGKTDPGFDLLLLT